MSGLNHWWQRFEKIRATLRSYKKEHKLESVEECIEHLLLNRGEK
jgi:hypothetical protein